MTMQFTREDMARDFAAWRGCAPLRDSMIFTEAALVLGRGTLLATLEEYAGAGPGFDEPRILAHLIGAYGQPVSGDVIKKIRRASALWRAGDKGLAQIYLALAGLPRISDWDAYRLHLVNKLLRRGLGPGDVLKIMGFQQEARELEKKCNQNQPRVPSGSGAESGRWTSGGGGGAGQRIVQRVDVKVVGATRSDAGRSGVISGAQYAQANPAPVISADAIQKIRDLHFVDSSVKDKGKFNAEYSNEAAIKQLVEDAWRQARPEDFGPGYWHDGRAVIAAQVLDVLDGVRQPHIIGDSATGRPAPSIPTNTYVVIIDSDNKVITCYPINPVDKINPRND
jgi:hypothetical protein